MRAPWKVLEVPETEATAVRAVKMITALDPHIEAAGTHPSGQTEKGVTC